LLLDLDETLIHSKTKKFGEYDYQINVTVSGILMCFYVCLRPGVQDFLKTMSEYFEIVIFTASLPEVL
jgi:RNA polymerase II subunit A small phosphatase-like protein